MMAAIKHLVSRQSHTILTQDGGVFHSSENLYKYAFQYIYDRGV